jgi:hypothetical protein
MSPSARTAPRRRLRVALTLAGAALALGLVAPHAAHGLPIDDGDDPLPRPTTTRRPTTTTTRPAPPPGPPRYKVEAVSFKADDESSVDWTGSDEPLWVFNGVGADGVVRSAAREFGDVDTGETRSFNNLCVVSDCVTGVAGPLSLQVTLTETDWFGQDIASYGTQAAQYINLACPYLGEYKVYCVAAGKVLPYLSSWMGDDLIESRTIHWPLTDLAPMTPGQAVTESVSLSDGDADYTFTFRTTRLS